MLIGALLLGTTPAEAADRKEKLLLAGGIVLAATHVPPLLLAAAHGFANEGGWLLLPGAGPFIYLGERDPYRCSEAELEKHDGWFCGMAQDLAIILLTGLMGAGQVTGISLLGASAATSRSVASRWAPWVGPQKGAAVVGVWGTF